MTKNSNLFFERVSVSGRGGSSNVFSIPVNGLSTPRPQISFVIVIGEDQLNVHPFHAFLSLSD